MKKLSAFRSETYVSVCFLFVVNIGILFIPGFFSTAIQHLHNSFISEVYDFLQYILISFFNIS